VTTAGCSPPDVPALDGPDQRGGPTTGPFTLALALAQIGVLAQFRSPLLADRDSRVLPVESMALVPGVIRAGPVHLVWDRSRHSKVPPLRIATPTHLRVLPAMGRRARAALRDLHLPGRSPP